MKRFAVIVAGGSGTRMGAAIPKQFIELHGKPILLYSVDAFFNAYPDMQVIIVLPQSHLEAGQEMLVVHGYKDKQLVLKAGGPSRFHSVQNGLASVDGDAIVFIHDAVRCLVSPQLIRRCGEAAAQTGAAIPVIKVRDSMRQMLTGGTSKVISREDLRIVQTPQTFHASIIKEAFTQDYRDEFTDEASVLEYLGKTVTLVEGEESNLKITFKEDLDYASWKLQNLGS